MDLYISSLLLGAGGLAVMALSGLGTRGHGGSSHSGHGRGHGQGRQAGHGHGGAASRALWAITSPRFLFSLALGFGAVGEATRPVLGGVLQLAAAVAGGILFERLIVTPLWNFAMRFASTPARTLESAITDEATAVTAFDANGQGIVSIEVDGQIVQCLATLNAGDRGLGVRVRAGQRVRIEDVSSSQNRCTVSLI
ncbi:MAG TPA: hypothetical protein VH277_10070 [Gemmatimonadaceae bacterium]|jgi:hypothetical protein|nr:hypothetical protein [Gemmatimonadaceae bacterium]